MENAHSSIGSCTLPTGVKYEDKVLRDVQFREMTGIEEDIIASASMGTNQKITELMVNCTLNFGGYTTKPDIRKCIERLVITDRMLYLVQLRIHSLGSSYEFTTTCPKCSKNDKVIFDLRHLKILNAPDATQTFREFQTPSGVLIRWKIGDAESDGKIERMAKDSNAATIGLFARVTEINNKPAVLQDVVQLPMRDRAAFREEIKKNEGQIDDEYEATCPHCGTEYKSEMPMEKQSFFAP